MAFPNPGEAPQAFLDHLKPLNLHSVVTAFEHYETRPIQAPGTRYDDNATQQWCDRMDTLLVSAFDIRCQSEANR
jgi:hypothetical protein